jgi:hypothetical protein
MKAISKNKVQRMRNLVTGNYSSKTSIQTGFSTKAKKYKEGDVWEVKGKSWTIKNGIKQSITKQDIAREYARIPSHCPKCSTKMNKEQHKFMYVRFKHCLFCQTKHEQQMRIDGVYDSWKNKMISNNFEKWASAKKEQFKDWLISRNSKIQITEAGQIEAWEGGQSIDELLIDFDKYMKVEKEKLATLLTSIDTNIDTNTKKQKRKNNVKY